MPNKKPTITEIAEFAGVSKATVSRVMNHRSLVKPETVRAVEEAMSTLGFTIGDRTKRPSVSRNLIILSRPRNDSFYDEIILGAKTAAKTTGSYLLENSDLINAGNVNEFCALLKRSGATGVIMMSQLSTEILDTIASIVPLVQCCEFNPEADHPYISIDDYSAAQIATEYLISCGCRRIALLNSSLDFKYAAERRRGYYSALNKAKISVPQYWDVLLPDNSYSLAHTAVTQLLQFTDRIPDAIFATSDIMAAAALNAATAIGLKVPKDLMIVGFDDIELAQITSPSLTTIRQPRYSIGYTAFNMVLQQISDPYNPPKSMIVNTEFIVRDSTASPFSILSNS